MTVHTSMAPHKSEQKHDRNLFPECLGGGHEHLRSAAIRTTLQANPPHFVPLCHVVRTRRIRINDAERCIPRTYLDTTLVADRVFSIH